MPTWPHTVRRTRVAAGLLRGDHLPRLRPRTHMVSVITVDGGRWLADVGFGSGLQEPIPLRPMMPVTQGSWSYRLVQSHDEGTDLWLLQERATHAEWITRDSVAEERHHLSDVVMSNHYTSTWPESPFVHQVVVVPRGRSPARAALPAGLTPREAEVIRLVALGLTTRRDRGAAYDLGENRRSPCAAHLHQARRIHPWSGCPFRHRARHPAIGRIVRHLVDPRINSSRVM